MNLHYELEVKSHDGIEWVRQKHDRYNSIHEASQAASLVRRLVKRDTRIVEVTVDERIIHDPYLARAS